MADAKKPKEKKDKKEGKFARLVRTKLHKKELKSGESTDSQGEQSDATGRSLSPSSTDESSRDPISPPPETVSPPPEKVSPPPETVSPPPEKVSPPPETVSPPPETVSPPPEPAVTAPSTDTPKDVEPALSAAEPPADVAQAEPEVGPSEPVTQIAPSEPEVAPAEPEIAPAEPEVAPAEPEVAPVEPEVAPAESDVAPSEPEIAPSEPEIAPSEPEIAPLEPEVAPSEPEVAPSELKVHSEPEAAPSEQENAPSEPEVSPFEPQVSPAETEVAPSEPVAQSEPEVAPSEPDVTQSEPDVAPTGTEVASTVPVADVASTEPEAEVALTAQDVEIAPTEPAISPAKVEADVVPTGPEAEVAPSEPDAELVPIIPETEVHPLVPDAEDTPLGEVASTEPTTDITPIHPGTDDALAQPKMEVFPTEPVDEVVASEPAADTVSTEPPTKATTPVASAPLVEQPAGAVVSTEPVREIPNEPLTGVAPSAPYSSPIETEVTPTEAVKPTITSEVPPAHEPEPSENPPVTQPAASSSPLTTSPSPDHVPVASPADIIDPVSPAISSAQKPLTPPSTSPSDAPETVLTASTGTLSPVTKAVDVVSSPSLSEDHKTLEDTGVPESRETLPSLTPSLTPSPKAVEAMPVAPAPKVEVLTPIAESPKGGVVPQQRDVSPSEIEPVAVPVGGAQYTPKATPIKVETKAPQLDTVPSRVELVSPEAVRAAPRPASLHPETAPISDTSLEDLDTLGYDRDVDEDDVMSRVDDILKKYVKEETQFKKKPEVPEQVSQSKESDLPVDVEVDKYMSKGRDEEKLQASRTLQRHFGDLVNGNVESSVFKPLKDKTPQRHEEPDKMDRVTGIEAGKVGEDDRGDSSSSGEKRRKIDDIVSYYAEKKWGFSEKERDIDEMVRQQIEKERIAKKEERRAMEKGVKGPDGKVRHVNFDDEPRRREEETPSDVSTSTEDSTETDDKRFSKRLRGTVSMDNIQSSASSADMTYLVTSHLSIESDNGTQSMQEPSYVAMKSSGPISLDCGNDLAKAALIYDTLIMFHDMIGTISQPSAAASGLVNGNGNSDQVEADILQLTRELNETKAENQSLQRQLSELKEKLPMDCDDPYGRLLAEKENLATEVYQLRQQLDGSRPRHEDSSSSIGHYDPDNPTALKRKIADLQGQLQDLQEAHESAAGKLGRAEHRIHQLEKSNEQMESVNGISVEDLQAENQYLRNQLEKLSDKRDNYYHDADARLSEEIAALRADMRTLRERNQQVNEDNIRLREEMRDVRVRSDERERRLRNFYNNKQSESSPKFTTDLSPVPLITSDKYSSLSPDRLTRHDDNGYGPLTSTQLPSSQHSYYGVSSKLAVSGSYYIDELQKNERARSRSHSRSGATHRRSRGRSHGYDDDSSSSTSSILEEVERELGYLRSDSQGRSRSLDSRGSRRSRARSASPGDPALTHMGYRSVSPRPLITQHNKAALGFPTRQSLLSTSGKRPFAPRSPADIKQGDVVKFSRQNGKISKGLVKFVGHLPGRNDMYLGLELESEDGKHDGTYNGQRFFSCKHNKGVFVTFSKVVMVWG